MKEDFSPLTILLYSRSLFMLTLLTPVRFLALLSTDLTRFLTPNLDSLRLLLCRTAFDQVGVSPGDVDLRKSFFSLRILIDGWYDVADERRDSGVTNRVVTPTGGPFPATPSVGFTCDEHSSIAAKVTIQFDLQVVKVLHLARGASFGGRERSARGLPLGRELRQP